MENYTKYQLKAADELEQILAGSDDLFVIACNKCFKEFETVDEPDLGYFEAMANHFGKTVVGSTKVDFLCNKTLTAKKLEGLIPENAKTVVVIS